MRLDETFFEKRSSTLACIASSLFILNYSFFLRLKVTSKFKKSRTCQLLEFLHLTFGKTIYYWFEDIRDLRNAVLEAKEAVESSPGRIFTTMYVELEMD